MDAQIVTVKIGSNRPVAPSKAEGTDPTATESSVRRGPARDESGFERVRGAGNFKTSQPKRRFLSLAEIQKLQTSYQQAWGLTAEETAFLIGLQQEQGIEVALSGTKGTPRIGLSPGGATPDAVAKMVASGAVVSERIRVALESCLRRFHPNQLNALLDIESTRPVVARTLLEQVGFHIESMAPDNSIVAYQPSAWTRRKNVVGERVEVGSVEELRRLLHLVSPQALAKLPLPLHDAWCAMWDAGCTRMALVDEGRALEGFLRSPVGAEEIGVRCSTVDELQRQIEGIGLANGREIRAAQDDLVRDPKGSERAARMKVLESALRDPNATVVSRELLTGGIMNTVWLVELSNGLRAVWKPAEEESEPLRENLEPDRQGQREVAAYVLDEHMGHLAGVPPTVYRELKGSRGALQVFVAGLSGEEAIRNRIDRDPDSSLDLSVFYEVIGNLDRKLGNYLVNGHGVLLPIEHGLSLPLRNGRQMTRRDLHDPDVLSCFANDAPLRPDHVDALERLWEQREEVTRELLALDIDPRAIEAMLDRVAWMRASGMTHEDWMGAPERSPGT